MKITRLFLALAFMTSAFGTSVEEMSLKEMVSLSKNIWGGEIIAVRMTDSKGRSITNPEARTGPGLHNTLYFDVAVEKHQVLKSTKSDIPARISIPLWQMLHLSLGSMKRDIGRKSFFLLTEDLEPVYPAPENFQCSLGEEKKLKSLIRKTTRGSKSEPSGPDNPAKRGM